MFLHLLDQQEQADFWRATLHVIDADEALHEKEALIRESIARELTLEKLPEPGARQDLLASLERTNREVTANIFMLELAGVALVDDELHPAEESLLKDFSAALGFTSDEIEPFLRMASRAHDVHVDAGILIQEGPTPS
jgi:hypothetical protein